MIDRAMGWPMRYFDSEGVVWEIYPTRGTITPPITLASARDYSAFGCTGPAYLFTGPFLPLPPRVPFRDDAAPDTYRVYLDTATPQTFTVCSSRSAGTCIDREPGQCGPATGIPESQTRVVVPPVLSFTPPYHPIP